MRGKLPRYFLLSFISFCFFTVVFHTMADAQVVSTSTPVKQAETANQPEAVPTPTIYMAPPTTPTPNPLVLTQAKLPSPTPTIYLQPQQQISSPTQPTSQPTQASDDTTSPSPISSPTPTAMPLPTTSPTPQPTTQAGPVDLDALFNQYSAQYSVSAAELEKIAQCESGFNTNADTGLYAGMFQFSASTWESERGIMGLDTNPDLRKDPEEAIKTTAFMLSRGQENAWPNCH